MVHFAKSLSLIPILAVLPLVHGCAASRSTTTEKTAIEQALVSAAFEDAINKIAIDETVVTQQRDMPSTDTLRAFVGAPIGQTDRAEFLHLALKESFLVAGFALAEKEEDADLLVETRVAHGAIDDAEFLLGIPSVPIPIPAAGTVQTPEIALFKRARQAARVSVSLYAVDAESGRILLRESNLTSERFYTRWKLLIIFSWRKTNLPWPF